MDAGRGDDGEDDGAGAARPDRRILSLDLLAYSVRYTRG